jgi:3-(3-hydroxy-phenyl)propionate hydroxylase
MTQVFAQFNYQKHADQARAETSPAHHPVVIVGAGPVGLALAIDLAQRGIKTVVLDDSDRIGDGSRAICFAKRTLEIFDRLGMAAPALEKGVRWNVGKVFRGPELLYQFDLQPEPGDKMPAFINLQQYYVEKYLVDRALETGRVDLRWRNRVTAVAQHADHARVTIETPDGPYALDASWLVACDGARSPVRAMMGLDFAGEVFEDQFLIADVKMTAAFPTERWFWFDPPFHPGQSALLHKQPDDVWRIDLQLSPTADSNHEKQPEIVRPRIERMLGHKNFELEWISIYRFQCRRIDKFVHDRVIFAGDAAHQVSPFGARGANSGIQDSENLAWKLAGVLNGDATSALITSYNSERSYAADENIAHSTRSTDFIAPQSDVERRLRESVLSMAETTPFARRMVNPGRLSTATHYPASSLSTSDTTPWSKGPQPGSPLVDQPLGNGRHISDTVPPTFALMTAGGAATPNVDLPKGVAHVHLNAETSAAAVSAYGLEAGGCYLFRPDGHIAARFKTVDPSAIKAATERALAKAA